MAILDSKLILKVCFLGNFTKISDYTRNNKSQPYEVRVCVGCAWESYAVSAVQLPIGL